MKIFRIISIAQRYKNLQFKSKTIECENEINSEINITIYYTHIKYAILQKIPSFPLQ